MGEAEEMVHRQPLVYLASGSPQRRAILKELGISYRLLPVDVEEIVAATPRETVEENASRKLLAGLRAVEQIPEKPASPGWEGFPDADYSVGDSRPPMPPITISRKRVGRYFRRALRICWKRWPWALGTPATDTPMPLEERAIVIAADTVLEAQGRLLGKPDDELAAGQYLQMLSGNSAVAYSAVAVARAGSAEGVLATETAEVRFKTLPPETIRWYLSTGEPMGRAGAFGISRRGEVLTESINGCHSCVAGLPKTALIAALARATGAHMPDWLQNVPPTIIGTRVQLRPLAFPSF